MKDEDVSRRYNVIIVGAGPTGLTLANLLGPSGLSVLVVERNPSTVYEPRAVSIDDESLRTLQATGLADTVMQTIVPGYGSRYLTPGGACFLEVAPSDRPYGFPRRNAFRQPVLERQLREGLDRFDNVTTLFGTALVGAEQGECVHASFADADGARTMACDYLVGCDGASSTVRKIIGARLEGATLPERWLIVDLENSPAGRDTLVFCDSARPCIALPGPGGTRRFEYKLTADETDEVALSEDFVSRLMRSRGADPDSRIVRKAVYTFHARVADRWRDGRMLIAGDAAHLTPPFAGQGMNSGIRDAHNLAWKLHGVISGSFHQDLLDTYVIERRPHVESMIKLALRMGRIMAPGSRWRGLVTQSLFRLAGLWPRLRSYFGEMKYKPGPRFSAGFFVSGRSALSGRLLPQPIISRPLGEAGLLDTFLPNGLVLLGIDVDPAKVEGLLGRLDTGGVEVSPVSLRLSGDGDRENRSLLAVDPDKSLLAASGSLLIVRPDRYVAAAFDQDDEDAFVAAVGDLFARYRVDRSRSAALSTVEIDHSPGGRPSQRESAHAG